MVGNRNHDGGHDHTSSYDPLALQAALFAGIQAQLLSGIPTDQVTPLIRALTFFSYAGLAFSIGASMSAMYLLDFLGEVPEQYWRSDIKVEPLLRKQSDFQLLKSHGGDRKIPGTYFHCHIWLMLGALSLLLQIALLAWLKSDSRVVFVFVMICLIWVFLCYPGIVIIALFRALFKGIVGEAQ